MRQKNWLTGFSVLALSLIAPQVQAADHLDGKRSSMTVDASADIADVFSWMSGDGNKVYLAMTFAKNATAATKFNPSVVYVFHTGARKMFSDATNAQTTNIMCQFDNSATQNMTCWVVVKGVNNASDTVSETFTTPVNMDYRTADMKVRAMAGLRDDPFYFYLDGFKHVAAFVIQNKSALTFDQSGCPALSSQTSAAAVALLNGQMNGPAVDDFAKATGTSGNVLAIILSVDKTLLTTTDAKLLRVWGSTNKVAP
jgi:hypothetical protein